MNCIWKSGGWRAAIAVHAVMNGLFVMFIALAVRARPAAHRGDAGYRAYEAFNTDPIVPGEMESVVATGAAILLSMAYLSFRPVTAALVLLALCGWLIVRDRRSGERTAALWLIIPITALMVNLHLYAIFVPMWIGALWVGSIIERQQARPEDRPEAERRLSRNTWLMGGTALACLATPMLPGVIGAALHYQLKDPMVASGVIQEMRPFYSGIPGKVSAVIVVVLTALALRGRRKLRAGDWVWLALSMILLFRLGRFSPAFAIAAAPIYALTIPRMSSRLMRKPMVLAAVAIVLVMGSVQLIRKFPSSQMSLDNWLDRGPNPAAGYPCDAAAYIATSVKPVTGRLINEFTWGGYLEWRLGDHYKTLLDGRTQLFSAAFWDDTYLGGDDRRAWYLSHVTADAAILPAKGSKFEKILTAQHWQVAWHDERSIVLLPPPAMVKSNSAKWPFATVFFGE
jgi:hypothetical protein